MIDMGFEENVREIMSFFKVCTCSRACSPRPLSDLSLL